MKLKNTLLFVIALFFSLQIFGQPSRTQFLNNFLYSEVYRLPYKASGDKDSTQLLYYIYRIPYNRLVFEKSNNGYTASYRLIAEVRDSLTNNIIRKIKEDKISVDDFEQTDNGSIYIQGILSFQIPNEGMYNLIPVFYDNNSGREIRLNKIALFSKVEKKNQSIFLTPLVVDSKNEKENNSSFTLSNFDGSIPFSKKGYDLLIPCSDTTLNKIYTILVNNKDTVFGGYVTNSIVQNNIIKEDRGEIILKSDGSSPAYKNFIIPFVNNKLSEGDLNIYIYKNKESEASTDFIKKVKWVDKPFSLLNPESAIKFLKYMESDSAIDSLLDYKKKDYPAALLKFWKKYDPTPETSFNELMNEYYARIDYTLKNFSSISGKRGFDTDRGKIFILYGKPSDLERTSDKFGKIVETWIYKNPDRKFIFVDRTGTGEYQLISG